MPADGARGDRRPLERAGRATETTPTSGAGAARTTAGGATRTSATTSEPPLGPLDTPPFYAVRVHSGALGTKGGPRTDGDGRVLDVDGHPIAGLYAAGNVMGSVMGMTYGGAGGTLGPAMVFGYLAGRHAAGFVQVESD